MLLILLVIAVADIVHSCRRLLSLIDYGLLMDYCWEALLLFAAEVALGVIIPPSTDTNFMGTFEELSGILRI